MKASLTSNITFAVYERSFNEAYRARDVASKAISKAALHSLFIALVCGGVA